MLSLNLMLLLTLFTTSNLPVIYQFRVKAIDGGEIDFSSFQGKKILIVNTASYCGFTYQYEDLEKLYQQYKNKLVVVGFPSNDFLWQEPGSNEEIAQFCSSKYHVTFPISEKIVVKGKNAAPLYQWLTKKKLNGVENSEVSWNFNKYLINEKGEYVKHFGSKTKPLDAELIEAINR